MTRPKKDWWEEALRLEAEGRFKEAERKILRAGNDMGLFSQCAYLYELRFARCLEAGDIEGANWAMGRAGEWLGRYMNGATSGGEGYALSQECDDRMAVMTKALKAAQ
jgi:hypothetical protein